MVTRILPFLMLALASFGLTRVALAAFPPTSGARQPSRVVPPMRAPVVVSPVRVAETAPCRSVRVVYPAYGRDAVDGCAGR